MPDTRLRRFPGAGTVAEAPAGTGEAIMAEPTFLNFDTLSLHAGQQPDPATGARAVPIYQTTSFVFDDTDHAAALFNLERPGYIYSRIANPTVAVVEERLAALEGGTGAVCTASGQAATHLAIATLMGAGGHIVASASLYGGTINLLAHTLPRFGIETSFVPPRDLAGFAAAIRPPLPRRSSPTPGCCSPRPWAIRGSRCPTWRPSPSSPTTPACR